MKFKLNFRRSKNYQNYQKRNSVRNDIKNWLNFTEKKEISERKKRIKHLKQQEKKLKKILKNNPPAEIQNFYHEIILENQAEKVELKQQINDFHNVTLNIKSQINNLQKNDKNGFKSPSNPKVYEPIFAYNQQQINIELPTFKFNDQNINNRLSNIKTYEYFIPRVSLNNNSSTKELVDSISQKEQQPLTFINFGTSNSNLVYSSRFNNEQPIKHVHFHRNNSIAQYI